MLTFTVGCDLCGVEITDKPREEILRIPRTFTPLFTVNLEFLYWYMNMRAFWEALNHGLKVADGKWVVWLCRQKGVRVEHLPGSRIVYDFLSLADEKGLRVLFFGSTDDVLDGVKRFVAERYPNVEAFTHNPGTVVYPFSDTFLSGIQSLLEEIRPHLVFVALGPPFQEILIHRLSPALEKAGVKLAMGVGGTFEMMAGVRKPAPRIVSSLGLEWLWHLIQRPSRIEKVKRSLWALWKCISQ